MHKRIIVGVLTVTLVLVLGATALAQIGREVWSAPGKLEKVSHRFRTGRSAGFMFRTAASNSAGGT